MIKPLRTTLISGLTTIMLLCVIILFNADMLSAQTLSRDLNREILVYILPDSLEIPTEVRDLTTIDKVTIRSGTLAEALGELSISEIARSFPDWAADDSVRVREDGRVIQRPRFDRVFTIFLPANQSAEAVIERLESLPSVLYAERHMDASLTNDPQYAAQWHLNNTGQAGGTSGADISAEQAWQIFTGSSDIKIGIFDTGVDLSHTEFAGKISGDNISYDIPEQSEVLLQIFDLMGRKIVTLESAIRIAGRHTATFDASQLSSGLYIARLRAIGISGKIFTHELKMQLVK